MTADVIQLKGKSAAPRPRPAGTALVPAQVAPVTRLCPEDEQRMRGWAEERFRDAIRVYRAFLTPEELTLRLIQAAEDELRLAESDR